MRTVTITHEKTYEMLSLSPPGRLMIALLVAAVVSVAGVVLLPVFDAFAQIPGPPLRWNVLLWVVLFAASGVGLIATVWRKAEGRQVSVAVREAAPRIMVCMVEGPTAVRLAGQHLKVWHVTFVNDPVTQASSAVVPDLTAVVEFRKSHGEHPFEPLVGLWAKTQHTDAKGWTDSDVTKPYYTFANEIILPLMPARAKLMLLGQHDGLVTVTVHGVTITMRDVFALPADIVASPSHVQYAKYRIYPDVTQVLVRLHAKNISEQQFRFALRRDYEGQVVLIDEIPM